MNARTAALRSGLARGWIEFKQTWTNAEDLISQLVFTVLLIGTVFFMRNATLPGTSLSLGAATVPGLLGAGIVFTGLTGAAGYLAIDREDGTLLRAKATPHGMLGYLVGKTTMLSLSQITSLVAVLIPCLFVFPGLAPDGVRDYLHLAWVLVIGLFATMPIGAALGSLAGSSRSTGLIVLPVMGLGAISGIFYPITALPEWVQGVAQVFPMYWLGLGMRSALLPDTALAAEIGQSWRPLPTLAVLVAWSVIGLVLAPILLRRMARREAGSSLAQRRQKAMQRVG
ncbi:ABC transporter permease [Amycolatopsis tolypomycina]|uniref:Transport permease protein n=1 Tax=Amycolatopsis tolypomycina TaxID=208445 RepID=A0A1H5AGL8_9PSEU|nr:ABC transporter permease [Amycolatopsis tolypomycina]SED41225.1 ABC-2 type transport system permease protein [Amycolatopsis tolypomycina]